MTPGPVPPRAPRGHRPPTVPALLGVAGVVLAGCGAAPAEGGEAPGGTTGFTGCVVSDPGGFQDGSVHQDVHEGLKAAGASGGIEVRRAEPQTEADVEPHLISMVQQGCDLIVSAGPVLADATRQVAAAYPGADFAIVDDTSIELDNVKPVVHHTAEAAFLAGYVAAGTTRTGAVATYGGMDVPTVTVLMDGFADGVAHYNEVKGEDVAVLGWDQESRDGTFVGSFTDTAAARTTTQDFVDEGADIVLPVAGRAALGTVDAVAAANSGDGGGVRFVWVGADAHEFLDQGQEHQLTAVLQRTGTSVQEVVESAARGGFSSEPYVGTLGNDGVGLAPYHHQEETVGDRLAAEVEQLEQDIVDGTITLGSRSAPGPRRDGPAPPRGGTSL